MPRTDSAPIVTVAIDCKPIVDAESFHDVVAKAFGFPEWYGRNWDAWIDILMGLDAPGQSEIIVPKDGIVQLKLSNVGYFSKRAPKLYAQDVALVNHYRVKNGDRPILIFSFDRSLG